MLKRRLKTQFQFSEALSYIKDSKEFILFAIVIFLASTLFGYFFRADLTFLDDVLKDLVYKTEGLNTFELIFFILQNNLLSSIISVIAGILLGIFPIINAVLNGAVLGYVLGIAADEVGFLVWWRLLPHGVFELPAILISLGLGIKLGFSLFESRESRMETFRERFYNSANAFLMIIIPLLILAAFIEGILISFVR